mmetsp:Transcript_46587/g.137689  ORF Transcript_46587/g.137689 Transcript_46587/m.137689 type:complete len:80 (+) Transcript_46587:35-274(+)|eukprot:5539467-Prymnesium_polylepis.1
MPGARAPPRHLGVAPSGRGRFFLFFPFFEGAWGGGGPTAAALMAPPAEAPLLTAPSAEATIEAEAAGGPNAVNRCNSAR